MTFSIQAPEQQCRYFKPHRRTGGDGRALPLRCVWSFHPIKIKFCKRCLQNHQITRCAAQTAGGGGALGVGPALSIFGPDTDSPEAETHAGKLFFFFSCVDLAFSVFLNSSNTGGVPLATLMALMLAGNYFLPSL